MTADTTGSRPPAPLRHAHLRLASGALEEVLRAREPADAVLRELFAKHRNAGSRDRAQISELVYGVLRNYFRLRAALGEGATPQQLCEAQAQGTLAPAGADAATRHNLPAWLWRALEAQYGDDAGALADALNTGATVDLRVNTLKATREAAQAALREDGIDSTPTPRSPTGLRLAKREALQRTRAFRDGLVEPQDEGSQLLAQFVEPKAGEVVVDFCAGAGGKTLALGALMRNRGELHALDTRRTALQRFEPRLTRSGLTIARLRALRDERDAWLNSLAKHCDAVLVDAPCSATGTLRRNPELRLRAFDLAELTALQQRILDGAARLVKPGGRLVYATCSVLAEENQQVAARFVESHADFKLAEELVLLPHRDGTDGFYAARLLSSRA